MAKMTLSGLASAITAYADSSKQAGAYVKSTNNSAGLLDKIGRIKTIDGNFQDKLPELDGENLPLGKTIEEYFIDLTLPENYDSTGATTMAPRDPSFESVVYSYTLGRKVVATSVRYNDIQRAMLTNEGAGNFYAKIVERLENSTSLFKYALKKQLIANMISKAEGVGGNLVDTVAVPSDTLSSEAFITEVKKSAEEAQFANEGHNLGNCLIGSAPSLTLYVKKGVMPVVQVEALAGAFQKEELAIPANVKIVDDFGDNNTNVYAVLVDPRGIKLHTGYEQTLEQLNAQGGFITYYRHLEFTGFISKYTYVKVFKPA